MSTKDSTPREWPNPADFGLPFVEITTLSSLKNSPKVELAVPTEPQFKKEGDKKMSKKEGKETKIARPINPLASPPKLKKKASLAWLGFVIVGFLAVVSVIVWQIQYEKSLLPEITKEEVKVPDSLVTLSEPNAISSVELSREPLANDTVTSSGTTTSISGTTIATGSRVNLTLIASKGEKTRFFIIVSSLPNEKSIRDYAEQLPYKPTEMFLIAPHENSPNYRLAIGKFDSWKASSAELARLKPQYTEDLWILNY